MKTEGEVIPEEKLPAKIIDQEYPEETTIESFSGDQMEIVVDVAEHLAKYEKALDTIMNFIVRRTYAGDWVSHDREGTPLEERTVNMIGAAAERIARDLGIQEKGRTNPVKHFEEKHPGHYYYECEGDFTFRGRTVHAIGRAGTLNPFYSKRGGGDRNPEDIREEYIIRDAYRDCTKQGIKGLFGLRKIPILKLKELGYDISKVKYVNFKEGGQGGKPDAAATARPQGVETTEDANEWFSIVVAKMVPKKSKNGKDFYSIQDSEGAWMTLWGNATSDGVKLLLQSMTAKTAVNVLIVREGQFATIREVRT